MFIRKLMIRTRQFSQDQGGMEALQTVCIVAIAATILIGAATFGGKGSQMMKDNFGKLDTEIQAISGDSGDTSGETAGAASGSKGGLGSLFGKD